MVNIFDIMFITYKISPAMRQGRNFEPDIY